MINSAGRYLFHELCLPWHSVHHSLPPVRKCNNLSSFVLFDLFVCPHSFMFPWATQTWVIFLTVFGASVTNLNEPPRALAASTIMWVRSWLHPFWGRCKQKQRGLRGLLCRWPSISALIVHDNLGPPSLKWPILCPVGR